MEILNLVVITLATYVVVVSGYRTIEVRQSGSWKTLVVSLLVLIPSLLMGDWLTHYPTVFAGIGGILGFARIEYLSKGENNE